MRVGGRGRGYRRRAGCAPAGAVAAEGERTPDDACPTWYGGQLCTGEDVDAWWLELERRASVVDSLESAGSPSAADVQRIATFRDLREDASGTYVEALAAAGNITAIGSVLGHYAVRSIVNDIIAAIEASWCVSQNWEGAKIQEPPKPKPPSPKPGDQDPGKSSVLSLSKSPGVLAILGAALVGLTGFLFIRDQR